MRQITGTGFGELEERVMVELWAAGRPLQVREVREALRAEQERELAHTTVMTVLDNLFRKGILERETADRAYTYWPKLTREAYTAQWMLEALAFAENPATALVHFLEGLTSEQRTALRDALRVALPDGPDRPDGPGRPGGP